MITCKLKGGLANMLFQIATMKSLAKDNDSDVSFPNFFDNINALNLDTFHNPKINYAQEYVNIFKNFKINTENNINIKENISVPFCYVDLEYKNNANYDGFFQCEKFFKHNRNLILDLYEPNDIIKEYIINKYSEIIKLETCAIHVRRGDYLKLQNVHVVQNLEYFNSAIDKIGKVDKYIVFSDDIEWCKNNFIGEDFIFISEDKDYIELFLMSMCSHQIISNSSFSWWGAWLNKNENKKVIGPLKWFNENSEWLKTIKTNVNDIIPENWIKL